MQTQPSPKRPSGSGSLFTRRDMAGRETWYGQWRSDGQLIKRALGRRKAAGEAGLTKREAEAAMRRLMAQTVTAPGSQRMTVEEAGARLLSHLTALGRKASTVSGYESALRVHLIPFFGNRPLHRIGRVEVEKFIATKRRQGLSPKSVGNYVGFLHSIFDYCHKRELVTGNPVKLVDKPQVQQTDPDVKFLTSEEVEALARAVPPGYLAQVERALYLTAAMTGARQGELVALRWRDVDWAAQRVRIRRNYVRGEYGTPKSKRSSRSVPLSMRLAGELERLHQGANFQQDDDLVFAHPVTGRPLDRSRLLKRFKRALRDAGIREVRFHDLRHSFGTQMAAVGVPMRTLQEWMGHRDFKTTLIYADYAPSAKETEWVERAFERAEAPVAA